MALNAAALTFEPEAHVYRLEGHIIPNVTRVIEPLAELWRVPRDVLEAACLRGTRVHKVCELEDRGTLDETSVNAALAPYLAAWRLFKREHDFEPDLIETRVVNAVRRYAGTLDRTGWIRVGGRRRYMLLDIKSGILSECAGVQTAAYKAAAPIGMKEYPHAIALRAGVKLGDDGRYTLRLFADDVDLAVFYSCLTVYNWKARNL
jgi:hypothetical protein